MKKIYSPWIYQLNQSRELHKLTHDHEADCVIVGAGIAGISTAFFMLKYTKKNVTILEGYKLAHGATGHNAGQVTSYFERPFFDIVAEFGLPLSIEGQQSIEDSWSLLQEMYTDAGLAIPFSRFIGHLGVSSKEQLLEHLKNNLLRKQGGLNPEEIYINDNVEFIKEIPSEYNGLYNLCSAQEILSRLETENSDYIATISYQKGCINSALFCEKVIEFLLSKYVKRCQLFEQTPVHKVVLHEKEVLLDVGEHVVKTDAVILCTNGFENLTILNKSGLDIDTQFHHTVKGTVGYMSGYLEKYNKPPAANSYFGKNEIEGADDPYFYLTRRIYEYEKGIKHNLICIGGPDLSLDDTSEYLRESDSPDDAQNEIDKFITTTYDRTPNKKIEYQFTWHGLMGYTPNRIRVIGTEPKNKRLLYNLGCNGVGILPSIYGGRRIACILGGEKVKKSIFDPKG